MKGNPFVLENNGWATPFTFTVGSDCDVNGISGLLVSPQVLDFGSVRLKSGPVTQQVTLQNIGNEPLNLQLPTLANGAQSGFSLSSPPSTPIIAPATNAIFNVTFNPTQVGMADGSVRIATDGGTMEVQLKGQGVDAASPTIFIQSPQSGDYLTSGVPFTIKFTASDNDALGNYIVQLSTDGGTSFVNSIIPADNSFPKPPALIWNIPSDLQISQAIIKITAQDKSGNPVSALSGLFSIGGAGGQNGNPGGDQNSKGVLGLMVDTSSLNPKGDTVLSSIIDTNANSNGIKNAGASSWFAELGSPIPSKACRNLKVELATTSQAGSYMLQIVNSYTGDSKSQKPTSFRIALKGDIINSITGGVTNGWKRAPSKCPPGVGKVEWKSEPGYIPNDTSDLGIINIYNSKLAPIKVIYEWLNKDGNVICKDSSIFDQTGLYYELNDEPSDEYVEVPNQNLNIQYSDNNASSNKIDISILDVESQSLIPSKGEKGTGANANKGLNIIIVHLKNYNLIPGKRYILRISDSNNILYSLNFKVMSDKGTTTRGTNDREK